MVVMHDAGDTLLDLVYRPDSAYRLEWQRSPRWRAAFLSHVGLSAINLVGEVALCHNDIRLPNIAVRDGRFCMIDFDFSSTSVLFQPRSAFSPPLKSLGMHWSPDALAMCYSVAQIAVNVFILSAPTQFSFADVTAAESLWSDVRDEACNSTASCRPGSTAGGGRCRASSRRSGPPAARPRRRLCFRPT